MELSGTMKLAISGSHTQYTILVDQVTVAFGLFYEIC